MKRVELIVLCAILVVPSSWFTYADVVEHSFHVENITMQRLCGQQVIGIVNGNLPGPTLNVREGDTVIIHVFNKLSYNLTIHWHGIFQILSGWADGPSYVTQCPILPGKNYTYKFNVTRQEGTLWWHAHVSWLRATVYGALIIRPKEGRSYPFPKPHAEFPILLGEWWNANVIDVEKEGLDMGVGPNCSDAYTINGQPGDLYPCSAQSTHKIEVLAGENYLLRIINAGLYHQFFFKIANHNLKVVAIDASYTNPYNTDVVVLAPGQTVDVLLAADQPPALYYMAVRPYVSAPSVSFTTISATAIIRYKGATLSTPKMPILPQFSDTLTAHKFYSSITGLVSSPFRSPLPHNVDEHMLITVGLGLLNCGERPGSKRCKGPFSQRLAASMNNASFQLPNAMSMLQAFYENVSGIYSTDFPNQPPVVFDYTNLGDGSNQSILTRILSWTRSFHELCFKTLYWLRICNAFCLTHLQKTSDIRSSLQKVIRDKNMIMTSKSTKVKKLKFNATVEIVLQNTAILLLQSHPIHLHGFNFYVLGQGFGNYDPESDRKQLNFIDPLERNTIAVPMGGWAVIQFRANNPGLWIMHCHMDVHLPWGLAAAFEVENGPSPSTTLPPPPLDYPQC